MKTFTFYTQHLVPAAQMLMAATESFRALFVSSRGVVIQTPNHGRRTPRELVNLYNAEALDALNLLNCEVQSWTADDVVAQNRLERFAALLEPLMVRWQKDLEAWCAAAGVKTSTVLDVSLFRRAGLSAPRLPVQTRMCELMAQSLVAQGPLLKAIHNALVYTPTTRTAWMAQRTVRHTPLMRQGKLSVWRTLARNMPWDLTLTRLGHTERLGQAPVFGSEVGKMKLPELFNEAFREPTAAPVLMSGASKPLSPDVSLTVTADGYLCLKTTYSAALVTPHAEDPGAHTDFLATNERAGKRAGNTFSFELTAAADMLGKALGQLDRWREAQKAEDQQVAQEFAKFIKERAQKRLVERLSAQFSDSEIELLKAHFKR